MQTLGYTQWADPYNLDIPNHLIDQVYHIETNNGVKITHNQLDLVYQIPVTVTVYKKGYRDVEQGYEAAITAHDAIIKALCVASSAKTQTYIKDVQPINFTLERLSESNDNIIKLSIYLNFTTIIDVNS